MFQFPAFTSYTLCIHVYVPEHLPQVGFPIRTSAGWWLFAPYRSFSQLATSFVGSWCQGIHPALFIAWPTNCYLAIIEEPLEPCDWYQSYGRKTGSPFAKSIHVWLCWFFNKTHGILNADLILQSELVFCGLTLVFTLLFNTHLRCGFDEFSKSCWAIWLEQSYRVFNRKVKIRNAKLGFPFNKTHNELLFGNYRRTSWVMRLVSIVWTKDWFAFCQINSRVALMNFQQNAHCLLHLHAKNNFEIVCNSHLKKSTLYEILSKFIKSFFLNNASLPQYFLLLSYYIIQFSRYVLDTMC